MKKEDVSVKENFKHSSQKDAAKGFGGKFGVQTDRKDKVWEKKVPLYSGTPYSGNPKLRILDKQDTFDNKQDTFGCPKHPVCVHYTP